MLTEENLISILFQIGFHEMEEHEIVFSSFEEKLEYREGKKRFLVNELSSITVNFNTKELLFYFDTREKEVGSYLKILSLDDMKDIFQTLNSEYSKELRLLKIKNMLDGGE